ncbi:MULTISPECIES: hypothetical protein [unclassified Brevibacterium]|nr:MULTISPECIES: hypothetical protein [unclassified Brevibacterium]
MLRISISLIVIIMVAVFVLSVAPVLGSLPETFEADEEDSDVH